VSRVQKTLGAVLMRDPWDNQEHYEWKPCSQIKDPDLRLVQEFADAAYIRAFYRICDAIGRAVDKALARRIGS